MKKLRCLAVSILLVCLSVALLLCACGEGSEPTPPSGSGSTASAGSGLVFDKKYVRSGSAEGRENYFIFRADGTGDFVRNYDSDSPNDQHYTMHFKWFYADSEESAVACFYDGVKYREDHQNGTVYDDTTYLVTVSEHVLCANNGSSTSYYINEDDLDKLPNFGMEDV